MDSKAIDQIFETFSQMRVLIIGDVMIDAYLRGKVERISPEAPVPVVSVSKREMRLGGAANVSLNIQALGATPLLFSVIGNDENGEKLKDLLEEKGLSSQGIFTDKDRKTSVKSRIISNGQHVARVDEESTENLSPELEKQIITSIQQLLKETTVDAIIFVDYDKGMITPNLFKSINRLALKMGIPTVVDPKKKNFRLYKNVTLFKPNFKEFTEGIGIPLQKGDIKMLKKAADEFKLKQNFDYIFITLSELGVFISNGEKESHFPAVIRDIADVSGAGDTVISVASLAVAAKLPSSVMATMANLAGGLVCEKSGVIPINKAQLKEEMKQQNF